jgi:hypothetical protein
MRGDGTAARPSTMCGVHRGEEGVDGVGDVAVGFEPGRVRALFEDDGPGVVDRVPVGLGDIEGNQRECASALTPPARTR